MTSATLAIEPDMWFDPDMVTGVDERIGRLNVAAGRRVIEPDEDLPGALGPGRVLPDELLSVHGLDLDLTEGAGRLRGPLAMVTANVQNSHWLI